MYNITQYKALGMKVTMCQRTKIISNKDKILHLSGKNAIYEITCSDCLQKRNFEHVTQHTTSAVAQHFLDLERPQFIADMNNQYD